MLVKHSTTLVEHSPEFWTKAIQIRGARPEVCRTKPTFVEACGVRSCWAPGESGVDVPQPGKMLDTRREELPQRGRRATKFSEQVAE